MPPAQWTPKTELKLSVALTLVIPDQPVGVVVVTHEPPDQPLGTQLLDVLTEQADFQ